MLMVLNWKAVMPKVEFMSKVDLLQPAKTTVCRTLPQAPCSFFTPRIH